MVRAVTYLVRAMSILVRFVSILVRAVSILVRAVNIEIDIQVYQICSSWILEGMHINVGDVPARSPS